MSFHLSPFGIYVDFESSLVSEVNRKQNPEEACTNKYQKHIACSYGEKLVYVDDRLGKFSKKYLSKNALYNFINSMIKKGKYCSDVITNILTKSLG